MENTTTQLTHVPASEKEPLKILPLPDGLISSFNQRDAYAMRITDQNDPSASIWKIGRSDDPLARAISLRSEVKRDRGWDWQHDVPSLCNLHEQNKNLRETVKLSCFINLRSYNCLKVLVRSVW